MSVAQPVALTPPLGGIPGARRARHGGLGWAGMRPPALQQWLLDRQEVKTESVGSGPKAQIKIVMIVKKREKGQASQRCFRKPGEGQSFTSIRSQTEQGFSPRGAFSGNQGEGQGALGAVLSVPVPDKYPDPSCSLQTGLFLLTQRPA